MRATAIAIAAAIRARFGLWLAVTFGFVVGYYVLLTLVVMARFGELPNYVTFSNIIDAYRLIWIGTPDLGDALSLMGAEILIETGYHHPVYRLALWSVDVMPAKTAVILLLGALVATYVVLLRRPQAACPVRLATGTTTATGVGAGLVGLSSATLFWAVCCGVPNWAVTLALLGFGIDTSFALEPFGGPMTLVGLAVVGSAVVVRAWHQRAPAQASAKSPIPELRHVH